MTDERQGNALWPAIKTLPRRSGIIVRHYSLSERERVALAIRIRKLARRHGHTMLVAGNEAMAKRVMADGVHRRSMKSIAPRLLHTVAVHNARELQTAKRVKADAILVSPIFPTRSHPGQKALGRVKFGMIASGTTIPVIALGDMTMQRARSLRSFRIHGWAAIGALTPEIKA